MIAHLLYRLEWNVRASTVLGMVGAGGLGQAIFNEQQLLHYQTLATYVIVAVGLVLIIDGLLARGRSRLYLRTLTG
jgi:phosphonate transport system permease protein